MHDDHKAAFSRLSEIEGDASLPQEVRDTAAVSKSLIPGQQGGPEQAYGAFAAADTAAAAKKVFAALPPGLWSFALMLVQQFGPAAVEWIIAELKSLAVPKPSAA